jgi:hypothetical protein
MEQQKKKDFFISYTGVDKDWAAWIAWQLEAAGYTTIIQDWDFGPGENFVFAMQKAVTAAARTIAVLSPNYLQSHFTSSEWAAAFVQDPMGEKRLVIPVRVREVRLTGLFSNLKYIDLVNCSEEEARKRLIKYVGPSINVSRNKPSSPPAFPWLYSTENHTISDDPEIKAREKQIKSDQGVKQDSGSNTHENEKSPQRKASTRKKKSNDQSVPPDLAESKKHKYEQIHGNKDDAIASEDYLGRQNLVNALTEILIAKENFHHQTIGLLGDWGAGKSTFVNLLKSSLKKKSQDQFLYAEFNAWEYEHTDHMQAGIAREAMKGLVSDLNWFEKIILAFRLAKTEKPWSIWLLACSTVVLVISIAIGLSQFHNPAGVVFVLASILGSSTVVVLWRFLASIQKMLKSPLVSEWKNYLSLPDYDRYLGTIPVMKQQISTLCLLRLGIGKPDTEQKRLL